MSSDSLATLSRITAQSNFDQEESAGPACPLLETGDSPAEQHAKSRPANAIPEIFRAKRSGGGVMPMLKTMMTTACERNCNYCCFRAGRDTRRETLKPDTMADLFYRLHQGGIAEGMFLSSGMIGGGVRTQDKILDTAEILRNKLGFKGYLHLKIMPGAEKDQVLRAMQLANRISINLEGPNPERLRSLAPLKVFVDELLQPLRWAQEIRRNLNPRSAVNSKWPSLATQFVVGGAGESDLELLSISQYLVQKLNLARVYYSRFQPVRSTPFENLPSEDPLRELRLYQAGFLLRDYGYTIEDFACQANGHLQLEADPKLAWARDHLTNQPLEINTADRLQLLRIPGIGPLSAKRILNLRTRNPIREPGALRSLGINVERALPFILINGKMPDRQPSLF